MSAERWNRINELFHQAAELPHDERDRFLEDACSGDDELLAELRSLLRHRDEPLQFLDDPSAAGRIAIDPERLVSEADEESDPLLGRTIGPYRLQRRIATGGMGAVYEGVREDEFLKHTVAVKILHRTPDAEELRRRFKVERQTLANLSHPNIARLQDAGVTADGLPYIIMELIDGVPIDEYCDSRRLSVRERLRLFQQVCAAVHFAHQNLVVHRDLKPGNILVTAEGAPKLLDFGIAKVLDPAGNEAAAGRTQTVAHMLSIDYASPEQIRGESVTTETDIYSLGVILYELLVGARPYRITSRRYEHMVRTICEDEPRRPSTAVRTTAPPAPPADDNRPNAATAHSPAHTAQQRGTTIDRLSCDLRGDLDNIVMMAMRKEPHRRYGSALQFAEDIQRYLDDHPVMARKDTLTYRAGKFIHRNRLAVAATAIIVSGLIATTLLVTAQARIVAAQRDAAREAEQLAAEEARHARIEAASANQVAEFLVDAFLISGPTQTPKQLAASRRLLDQQATRVRRQYADEPHLRANLLDAIGRVHMHLHSYDDAMSLMTEAADIRLDRFGAASLEYALSLNSLGELDFRQARHENAATKFRKSLRLHETLPHGVHTDVGLACNNLAVALRAMRQIDEAETLHLRALELRRAEHGRSHPLIAESLNNLAGINLMRGQYEQARTRLADALAIRRETLGDDHPLVAQNLNNLAAAHFQDGRLDEAEPLLREAIDLYRNSPASIGQEHARALRSLAEIRRIRSDFDEARSLLEESLSALRALYDEAHPHLATVLESLATLDEQQGRHDAAMHLWHEAVQIYEQTLPPNHPAQANALTGYALSLSRAARPDEALPLLQRALTLHESAHAPAHPFIGRAQLNLGTCLLDLARPTEAQPLLTQAMHTLQAHYGETSTETQAARRQLDRLDAAIAPRDR